MVVTTVDAIEAESETTHIQLALREMFNMDKGYGCGWYVEKPNTEHYIHGGDVGNYISFSAVYNAETSDRIYLVELFLNKDTKTQRVICQIYDAIRLELNKK